MQYIPLVAAVKEFLQKIVCEGIFLYSGRTVLRGIERIVRVSSETIRRQKARKQPSVSAKGAQYESQGQAPNNVRRVAPGKERMAVKL
ncbi:MAG TPA: hypothetical protein VF088_05920 [Pyrinomonadaceae bacterium]